MDVPYDIEQGLSHMSYTDMEAIINSAGWKMLESNREKYLAQNNEQRMEEIRELEDIIESAQHTAQGFLFLIGSWKASDMLPQVILCLEHIGRMKQEQQYIWSLIESPEGERTYQKPLF